MSDNSQRTIVEISKSLVENTAEDEDYKNQFILWARALQPNLSQAQAQGLWVEITSNDYGVYNPYVLYGVKSYTYENVDSPYNIWISVEK